MRTRVAPPSNPIKRIHDRWIGRYAARAVDLLTRLKEAVEED
jgi:hypothetical protein